MSTLGEGVNFFFSSRRRHTRYIGDWSSDVCSSALVDEPSPGRPVRGASNAAERERIIAALNACAGNQSRAAKLLGIPRRTFLTKLDGYGIPRPKKGLPDNDPADF